MPFAVCRWVGTCCSVSANLALGPEAPMVHLGACAAHVATHAACGRPKLTTTNFANSTSHVDGV